MSPDPAGLPDPNRRTALKALGVGAVGAFSLPSVPTSIVAQSVEDLLPAEEAVADPIQKESANLASTTTATVDGDVAADEAGTLSINMDGGLEGSGQFGFSASPYIKTSWTAPEDGLYRVEAEYTVDTSLNQNPYSEEIPKLATTLVSNSGVMDPSLTVVRDRSRREWGVRNRKYEEKTLEALLSFLTRRLISNIMGPLGAAVTTFILSLVFDQMVDATTLELDREWTTAVSSDFKAEKGQTYGIRFAPVAGVSGRAETDNGGFDATVSADYDVQRFDLKPISGLQEHELAIYPAGTGAKYRFKSTKSLRGGSNLEAGFDPQASRGKPDKVNTDTPLFGDRDPVRKASGAVGKREGDNADTYYYTGEITDWNHQGSAKMYIDGERWYPHV